MPVVTGLGCAILLLVVAGAAIAVGRSPAVARTIYAACIVVSLAACAAALAGLADSAAGGTALTLPLGLPWLGAHFRRYAVARSESDRSPGGRVDVARRRAEAGLMTGPRTVEELLSRGPMDESPELRLLFHRLNNQLGIILAHAELLESKTTDETNRARAAQVVASALDAMTTAKEIRRITSLTQP